MTKKELLVALKKYGDNEEITFIGEGYELGAEWGCDEVKNVYKVLGANIKRDPHSRITIYIDA